jgi:hypothetical protein
VWHLRLVLALIAAAVALGLTATPAGAGGFMMPEGRGQLIAGVGYIEASRTFNPSGKSISTPSFRKAAISGFVEYGLTPDLTIIVAPTAARMQAGSSSNTFSGSDESAFGARLRLWGAPTWTLAVQALVEPPLGRRGNPATEVALGGPHAFAADLRLQFGQSGTVFGSPAFFSLEPGVRLRDQGWPDEARFDVTFGVRPWPRGQILVQAFASSASGAGPLIPRTAYGKVQLSFVYDLSTAWSIQAGGLRTIVGRNAALETGPFAGVWYRF